MALWKLSVVIYALIQLNGGTGAQQLCGGSLPRCPCSVSDGALTCRGNLAGVNWFSLANADVKKIDIDGAADGLQPFAEQLPELTRVTELKLASSSNVELPSIDHLPNLEELSLKGNGLTDADVERLLRPWRHSKLAYVKLHNNNLAVYPTVLNHMSRLEKVKLKDNKIASLNWKAPIHFAARVQSIDLSGNNIETIEDVRVFQGDFRQAKLLLGGNPILAKKTNARAIHDLATSFAQVNLGDVNCANCSMAIFARGDLDLLQKEKLTGQCIGDKRTFKDLQPKDYPVDKCPIASSASQLPTPLLHSSLIIFIAVVLRV